MAKAKPKKDELDQHADRMNADPAYAIGITLWALRHHNPEMSLQIKPEEFTKYQACIDYLKVQPTVRIYRPQGTHPTPGKPAEGNRRAIPPHPGTPPKNYVVVQTVDQDGNAFVPIESTEDDAKLRDQRREMIRMKDRAPTIAGQILQELQSGSFTDGTLKEAAQILQDLAKAVP